VLKDAVLVMLLLTCTYTDLSKRLIYNQVLLPVAVFGLGYALLTAGLGGLGHSLAGLLLGFTLLLLPFCLGGLGAGDVKMLAVIGALQGPYFTWRAFLASALVGGVWALVYLARRGNLLVTLITLFLKSYYLLRGMPVTGATLSLNELSLKETMPYGAILAMGTMLTYLSR
jgi:prepilin peptidase CpaA